MQNRNYRLILFPPIANLENPHGVKAIAKQNDLIAIINALLSMVNSFAEIKEEIFTQESGSRLEDNFANEIALINHLFKSEIKNDSTQGEVLSKQIMQRQQMAYILSTAKCQNILRQFAIAKTQPLDKLFADFACYGKFAQFNALELALVADILNGLVVFLEKNATLNSLPDVKRTINEIYVARDQIKHCMQKMLAVREQSRTTDLKHNDLLIEFNSRFHALFAAKTTQSSWLDQTLEETIPVTLMDTESQAEAQQITIRDYFLNYLSDNNLQPNFSFYEADKLKHNSACDDNALSILQTATINLWNYARGFYTKLIGQIFAGEVRVAQSQAINIQTEKHPNAVANNLWRPSLESLVGILSKELITVLHHRLTFLWKQQIADKQQQIKNLTTLAACIDSQTCKTEAQKLLLQDDISKKSFARTRKILESIANDAPIHSNIHSNLSTSKRLHG